LEANIVNKVGERRVRGVARLKLAVLDPQVAREFGIIAAHLLDESAGAYARCGGICVKKSCKTRLGT
jgi:hypothetical protein